MDAISQKQAEAVQKVLELVMKVKAKKIGGCNFIFNNLDNVIEFHYYPYHSKPPVYSKGVSLNDVLWLTNIQVLIKDVEAIIRNSKYNKEPSQWKILNPIN
ncbi:hypothetical protein [Ohessyouella blattaphilus]|uniref:Uncharacterized protein n=1 Tax=Ohessyouella blattaphilus TaxID=2949333 RepID=A0ABT1EHZ9_9FIRM|nr:hypothetical protein [Ohessyouella blattaphilus]MCP1110320.1 hypothetical protein [Ohessyouella blattaphilus]MCR8563714.1 hypothetical protein [Ohessyouella blattaphilus]